MRRTIIITCSIIALYIVAMAFLPAPKPTVTLLLKTGALDTGQKPAIDFPASGQAAIGSMSTTGIVAATSPQKPTPMASTAKIVLALLLLQKKPITAGQTGPIITISAKDIDIYNQNLAQNGSVVPVNEGEQLTEYQALQALLLPSGNNIATTLAVWGFGSEDAYLTYANSQLTKLGLHATHLVDASGYSPQTVSTASDLVILGENALKNPILAEIVNQKEATIPVAGLVKNVNTDLGQAGINGIKTGNTDEAGGCLLFSAVRSLGNKQLTVVGAVMAQTDLQAALLAAPDLVEQSYNGFVNVVGIPTDKPVATMAAPWAATVNVVADKEANQAVWSGTPLSRSITITPGLKGTVGTGKIGDASTSLRLASDIPQPSFLWRVTHPLQMIGVVR